MNENLIWVRMAARHAWLGLSLADTEAAVIRELKEKPTRYQRGLIRKGYQRGRYTHAEDRLASLFKYITTDELALIADDMEALEKKYLTRFYEKYGYLEDENS